MYRKRKGPPLSLITAVVTTFVSLATASSPPVSAIIHSSWPAPSLVSLFAETLALESPLALFPFLEHLISTSSPALNPSLAPNETFHHLTSSLSAISISQATQDSLQMSLGLRVGSVPIEAMRLLWLERDSGFVGGEEGKPCDNWIDIADRKACSPAEFWEVVGDYQEAATEPIKLPNELLPLQLYSFDHLCPSTPVPPQPSSSPTLTPTLPLVVLYASPTDPGFPALFTLLYELAGQHRLEFALRWKPCFAAEKEDSELGKERLAMSGYGAGMDIKKSDYLAIDDRQILAGGGEKGTVSKEDLLEKPKMVQLKKEQLAQLSLRAAAHILASSSPLTTFKDLLASFPLLASTLVDPPPAQLLEALAANEHLSVVNRPSFTLNGLPLPVDSLEPFSLVRLMRRERKRVEDLVAASWGLMGTGQARMALMRAEQERAKGLGLGNTRGRGVAIEDLGERFDVRELKSGNGMGRGEEGIMIWWNDLEKDRRYQTWSRKVADLLRPVYPGQMILIGRNLNNLIIIVDLSKPASLTLVAENIRMFVSRGIPIRFGLVPLVGETSTTELEGTPDDSTAVAKIIWYLVERGGKKKTMDFIGELAAASASSQRVSVTILRKTYDRFVKALPPASPGVDGITPSPYLPFAEIMRTHSPLVAKARAYSDRLGIALKNVPENVQAGSELSPTGYFFLNGVFFLIDDDFTQHLQRTLSLHIQYLQQQVYTNMITDDTDCNSYFYDLPETHLRRNHHVFPDGEKNPLRIINLLEATRGKELLYVDAVGTEDDVEEAIVVSTIYVVSDLETPAGRTLVRDALLLLEIRTDVRVSILHNPTPGSETPGHGFGFSTLLYRLNRKGVIVEVLPSELVRWIDLDLEADGAENHDLDPLDWGPEDPMTPFVSTAATPEEIMESHLYWRGLEDVVKTFGFKFGETGLLINGRVLGPFPLREFEGLEILQMTLQYEMIKRVQPALMALRSTSFNISSLTAPEQTQLYTLGSSIISEATLPDPTSGAMFGNAVIARDVEYRRLDNDVTTIIGDHEETAVFEVGVVVDPVSELAQKWAPMIETLSLLPSVHLRVYLIPAPYVSEIPMKRFFQYSFAPSLLFDKVSGAEIPPGVTFKGLPEDTLFTFAMDVQRSWLAFPKSSIHDLDNIRLGDLSQSSRAEGVKAIFELESIIVEGHARDMPSGQPPRGLQLELQSLVSGDASGVPTAVDTICMSNLGYFQLKANPGPWRLAIREGRSSEVYEVESIGSDGWKSGSIYDTGDALAVATLEGLTIFPRFRRRPGMESAELLDESGGAGGRAVSKTPSHGFFDRVQSMVPFLAPLFAHPATDLIAAPKKAEINIFTVASGLLYERMAFIMIVSVLRHTNSTVKFWFIQNFLSPSFKAFIPHMAKEYNFEYELVTYKWPHWLRAQKEKQRTIWGYKILFLDVLFPLELDRVIFVDSDQIVRADLKELVDLDLQGAPYGYAPMGSDREETAGFRFWDSGYWKDHLKGKPYHISALYVIDLDRFRQIAAGDRLRQQYQGLSADPNSLANLDQDLPNNMQASIPIYTLDRNWLWCATWCSDESFADAKTIDLCNNPLTHEPKLARAKRLIPEWTLYDDEVAALASRVAAESSQGSEIVNAEIGAFSRNADELAQAVEQKAERDEFVEAESKAEDIEPAPYVDTPRLKDEL